MILSTFLLTGQSQSGHSIHQLVQKQFKNIQIVGESEELTTAVASIAVLKPQLVLIDINSSNQDFLQLNNYFPDASFFQAIVLADSRDYTIRSIRTGMADYLLKPLEAKEVEEALSRVEGKIKKYQKHHQLDVSASLDNKQRLTLPVSNGYSFIDIEDIIRCEASRSYTILYLKNDDKMIVSKPLRAIELMLENCRSFFRINRSHLINMKYLKSYGRSKNGYVTLKNGETLSLSSNKKDVFLNVARLL